MGSSSGWHGNCLDTLQEEAGTVVMEEEPRSWGVSPMLSALGIKGVNEKNTQGKKEG